MVCNRRHGHETDKYRDEGFYQNFPRYSQRWIKTGASVNGRNEPSCFNVPMARGPYERQS